jgi:GT2 family glycosyltransferase
MEEQLQTYTAEAELGAVRSAAELHFPHREPQPCLGPVVARSKFLWRGEEKLYVCGTTYGTFGPGEDGSGYPVQDVVEADFEAMVDAGLNSVRTYTPPPLRVLDAAAERGLLVMAGLPWEQHIAFLDDSATASSIVDRVRGAVAECAGHPALLAWSVGNEIPAPIVRWHGASAVEGFVERLYEATKAEDPRTLVTYVNYPTTEYLRLDCLDLVAFNVYLERRDRFEAYLAKLQNLAGDRPLLMAEIGLDSRRNGHVAQALSLRWQIDAAFAAGCAGSFVFAWTDEWWRGGEEIEDWDFGIVGRDRRPKPALGVVRRAFADAPRPPKVQWPKISIVVCTYNGAATIADTCEGIRAIDYPDFEAIFVSDGSTDDTADIIRSHGFDVIETENQGLSSARNTGAEAATGEIVAYLDDDAHPDPDWLTFLATGFRDGHLAVGGPNIPPPGDGMIADAVAQSPGGPIHVLLTDTVAEHIPGCNLAIRRDALMAIGGFDPQFRCAGDDVDICWRLQDTGGTLGFHHAAVVWHHRRNSVRTYWRQQKGYGKAEALLEAKWPQKYNHAGHVSWHGRLYGPGDPPNLLPRRWRVYHGTFGSAPFQSLYGSSTSTVSHFPLMPEWYLLLAILAALALLGLAWTPLLLAAPLLAAASLLTVWQAGLASRRAELPDDLRGRARRLRMRALIGGLWVAQPAARLYGRIRHGLTLWRRRPHLGLTAPRTSEWTRWSEEWRTPEAYIEDIEDGLVARGVPVRRGGDFDRWDLCAPIGPLGGARLVTVAEEHGSGKQLVRHRATPRPSRFGIGAFALAAAFAIHSAWADHPIELGVSSIVMVLIAVGMAVDCGAAVASLRRVVDAEEG